VGLFPFHHHDVKDRLWLLTFKRLNSLI